jgi:hypothetical protein
MVSVELIIAPKYKQSIKVKPLVIDRTKNSLKVHNKIHKQLATTIHDMTVPNIEYVNIGPNNRRIRHKRLKVLIKMVYQSYLDY